MSKIKAGDRVDYIGTGEQLVAIYLEDIPVPQLAYMEVTHTDYGTYDNDLSVYTDYGYVFPAKLLEVIYKYEGGAE